MKSLYVFIGGAIGALLRYAISFLPTWHALPVGTLICNLLGAFFMGFLTVKCAHYFKKQPHHKAFLTTGLLGTLTTFSTFQFELVELFTSGNFTILSLYALGSLCLGLLSCYSGMKLGEVRHA